MKKLSFLQFRSLPRRQAGLRQNVIGTFVVMFGLSFITYVQPVSAKVIIQEKGSVVIPATETIDDDLFVFAESVTIEGIVTGDVFVGAGTTNVSGVIKGGLFVGTGDLIVTGASIGNSLIAGAGNITLDSKSKIGGSLISASGRLKNSAPVSRNVLAAGETIYLDSQVGKEVRLGARTIDLGPNSAVAGDLTYALGEDESELKISPDSSVSGTISRFTPPSEMKHDMDKAREDMGKFGLVASRGWLVISFLGSLLLGFIMLKIFPKSMFGLSQTVEKLLMPSLGIGFLVAVFTLPIILVLMISVIGLSILGVLIPLFMVCLALAKLICSYTLGRFTARQFNWNKMGTYATFFIGLAIFYLLRALPGLGWVASLLFTWTGLGSIWIYTRSHLKNL